MNTSSSLSELRASITYVPYLLQRHNNKHTKLQHVFDACLPRRLFHFGKHAQTCRGNRFRFCAELEQTVATNPSVCRVWSCGVLGCGWICGVQVRALDDGSGEEDLDCSSLVAGWGTGGRPVGIDVGELSIWAASYKTSMSRRMLGSPCDNLCCATLQCLGLLRMTLGTIST